MSRKREFDGWNYRITAKTIFTGDEFPVDEHRVIEVYYDQYGEPKAWGEAGVPIGETLEELQAELRLRSEACLKSVIRAEDLPGA